VKEPNFQSVLLGRWPIAVTQYSRRTEDLTLEAFGPHVLLGKLITFIADDLGLLCQVVLSSDTVLAVQSAAVADHVARGELVEIRGAGMEVYSGTVGIGRLRRRSPPPGFQLLLEVGRQLPPT
jgi:DNA-binding transcriptional LysR family regulator